MTASARDPLGQILRPLTKDPASAAVFSDIDGVLAPIVDRPEEARVPRDVVRLLRELSRTYACVACVSGRSAVDARRLVGETTITYAGLHGAEILRPGDERAHLVPAIAAWQDRVRRFTAGRHDDALRRLHIRIEDKGPIAAFHWRGAPDEAAALDQLQVVARDAGSEGLSTHWGRKVLEVRAPVPIDKGSAVRHLVVDAGPRTVLFAGDDVTDLDAFDALDALVSSEALDHAVRVGVSSDEGPRDIVERADLVVDGPEGFARVLEHLLHDAEGAV
jgi:trehalose 6-phosphate phosphatase